MAGPSSTAAAPPFGELKGMRWDPEKGRYYKAAPGSSQGPSSGAQQTMRANSSTSPSARNTARNDPQAKKRKNVSFNDSTDAQRKGRAFDARGRGRHQNAGDETDDAEVYEAAPGTGRDRSKAAIAARTPPTPNHLVSLGLSPRAIPTRTRSDIRSSASRGPCHPISSHRLTHGDIQQRVWGSLKRVKIPEEDRAETRYGALPFPASLSCMSSVPGHPNSMLVGDERGRITALRYEYAPTIAPELSFLPTSAELGPAYRTMDGEQHNWGDRRWIWNDLCLGSKIVGLKCWNDAYTALSFGPRPRLVVAPIPAMLDLAPGRTFEPSAPHRPTVLWELPKLRDAWCMDVAHSERADGSRYRDGSFYGRSGGCGAGGGSAIAIAIGGSRQVIHAIDLDEPRFESCRLSSDALSVRCLGGGGGSGGNEVLAGLRSSQIVHIDFRQPMNKAASIRGELGQGKSVVGLEVLEGEMGGGRGVLASGFGNELVYLDTRFIKAEPVTRFRGHVNDFRTGLGMTLDPTGSIVFAAGSDHRIRAWLLRTGEPISTTASSLPHADSGLFEKKFDVPVSGLSCPSQGVLNVLNDRKIEVYAVNKDVLMM